MSRDGLLRVPVFIENFAHRSACTRSLDTIAGLAKDQNGIRCRPPHAASVVYGLSWQNCRKAVTQSFRPDAVRAG